MRYGNISISIYLSFYLVTERQRTFEYSHCRCASYLPRTALTLSSLDICSHQSTAEQVMQCCMLQSWPEMEFKIWTFHLVTANYLIPWLAWVLRSAKFEKNHFKCCDRKGNMANSDIGHNHIIYTLILVFTPIYWFGDIALHFYHTKQQHHHHICDKAKALFCFCKFATSSFINDAVCIWVHWVSLPQPSGPWSLQVQSHDLPHITDNALQPQNHFSQYLKTLSTCPVGNKVKVMVILCWPCLQVTSPMMCVSGCDGHWPLAPGLWRPLALPQLSADSSLQWLQPIRCLCSNPDQ